MADVVITIGISDVYKRVARRTSMASETDPFYTKMSAEEKQYSQLHGEGDRITNDFLVEATKEVLKCFVSRQGDAAGVPFEITATDIIFRFSEGTPVLGQADAIKSRLTDNVRDAIIYRIFVSLYRTDGNTPKLKEVMDNLVSVTENISGDLYRLHD